MNCLPIVFVATGSKLEQVIPYFHTEVDVTRADEEKRESCAVFKSRGEHTSVGQLSAPP